MITKPTAFNATSIGAGTDYAAFVAIEQRPPVTLTVNSTPRRNATVNVDSISRDPRTIVMEVWRDPAASANSATWAKNVKKLFDPFGSTSTRYLEGYGDDGSTVLRIGVYVVGLAPNQAGGDSVIVTMLAPVPYWEEKTATTSSALPATVTNNGNTAALPSLALTCSTHVTRRACTVVGAGVGSGHRNYPVLFSLADANATTSNVYVYINGRSRACYVINGGGVSSAVWALVDTDSDGTTATNVDIIYGSGLTNPLCQTLNVGNFDFTNSTNATWQWNTTAISADPAVAGSWRPIKTTDQHSDSLSFGFSGETSTAFTIGMRPDGLLVNDYNGIAVSLGGASATSALSNFGRNITNSATPAPTLKVEYRKNGSLGWTSAYSSATATDVTTDITVTSAVEIRASYTLGSATMSGSSTSSAQFKIVSSTNWSLALSNTPTVTVGTSTNVDHYNGTITINGYVLTFSHTFCPNDTLTIDCGARTISNATAGPIYNPPSFSDPSNWVSLASGSNACSSSLTGLSYAITYRGAFY